MLYLSDSGDEADLHIHNLREWTGVKYQCIVLLGVRAAPSVKYRLRKNVFTHMLTVHFQVGVSRLLCTLQLQSSYCEILDSLSAEALPDLLIFIHSIHTPVGVYKLQIFLIWKLLRFMTPLAIYLGSLGAFAISLHLRRKHKSLLFKYCPILWPFVVHQRGVKLFNASIYLRHTGYYMKHSSLGKGENRSVIYTQNCFFNSKLVTLTEASYAIKK